jgi:ribose transport system substrate-binding protein
VAGHPSQRCFLNIATGAGHFLARYRFSTALAVVAAALAAGCSDKAANPTDGKDAKADATKGGDGKITLVMIPKDTQATFWNQVRSGAERAAKEYDVELIWKGPATGNDRSEQKKVVQQYIGEEVDGILLAPTDSVALAPDVHTASAKGIPVLIFDSAVDGKVGEDFISLVATDNEAAGRLGGKHLMELVGKGAKTILFRHMEGHASTGAREKGALDEMKAAEANVLVENRYSGQNSTEAQNTALNMVDELREAAGVFASNQTSAEGLLNALKQQNLAGKIKFVGFDTSERLVEGLRDGAIQALVVQDPVAMGYQSVKLMVDHLHGKKVEQSVNTGAHLVTAENMNDPEIAPLLKN